jgi:hypothetical protein
MVAGVGTHRNAKCTTTSADIFHRGGKTDSYYRSCLFVIGAGKTDLLNFVELIPSSLGDVQIAAVLATSAGDSGRGFWRANFLKNMML